MQVFTCLWNLTMLGSSDLLFIDSYDTLIQSHACSNSRTWRYLFWKQKPWQLPYAQTPPMPHIYMRVASMVPHSYLVHFELVQTYCLSSYALHIPHFDHTRTRHQSLSVMINHTKAHHSPETKRKQVKWVIMLMDPCSKKREREKGEDDKSKSIDDEQVSLTTLAPDQSTWIALLLRDTLFESAK